MSETRITAIVLCKDAGETLDACLASLHFCDEVIVADDSSSDASRHIAAKHGATLYSLHQTSSFAKKRNEVMKIVKEGWVLFVDADEVVSPTLAAATRTAVRSTYVDAYRLQRRDIFLGKKLRFGEVGSFGFLQVGGVGSGNSLVRLGKTGCGQWRRRVHEVWEVKGKVSDIHKGEILHTPHPTISSFFDSINTYTTIEIEEREGKLNSSIRAWIELFFYPPAKFIFNFFIRLGFLDGMQGFIHAYMMGMYSLILRIKMLEYIRTKDEKTVSTP